MVVWSHFVQQYLSINIPCNSHHHPSTSSTVALQSHDNVIAMPSHVPEQPVLTEGFHLIEFNNGNSIIILYHLAVWGSC